jgi:hypothetical protein
MTTTQLSVFQLSSEVRRKGVLALCVVLCLLGLGPSGSAHEPTTTTFDAPDAGTSGATGQGTLPIRINLWGAIVGFTRDTNDMRHGFLRAPDGTFTTFDVPATPSHGIPGAATTGAYQGTRAYGINFAGAITGYYTDTNYVAHGYVRAPNGAITTFDVPGAGHTPMPNNATSTSQGPYPYYINLSGTIAGDYLDANNVYHGFVRSPAGAITTYDAGPIAPANSYYGTQSSGLNNGGAITGYYTDSSGVSHGYVRTPDGVITLFDAGAVADLTSGQGTFTDSINDAGAIAGSFTDANNVYHSFVRAPDGTLTTFDVPGACTAPTVPSSGCAYNGTSAASINLWGAITGNYTNASAVYHGFVRAAGGGITTFDAPPPDAGAVAGSGTLPYANNLAGQVTGYTVDDNGVFHGFVRRP